MQGGQVLDCICSVRYGVVFTIARPFLDRRTIFSDFFFPLLVFQDEVQELLLGSFPSAIGLIIEFDLQSACCEILESF